MNSACANKLLKRLDDDKVYLRKKEAEGCIYIASIDEEPVVPEYDYAEVAAAIEEIDAKIVKIKHAINVNNCTNSVDVEGKMMTIDEILVKMAQQNKRRAVLDEMRKHQPKTRVSGYYASRKAAPEYQYINYDIELIKKEYDRIDAEITAMQIALDKYNQTVEFEVDI
jgi:prefoldin subunit 5